MRSKVIIIIVSVLVSGVFFARQLLAEEGNIKSVPLNSSVYDDRFVIKNVSFFQRLESVVTTLNLAAEIHNNTPEDIKLKVILIAFKQADNVNHLQRKLIKYPAWRERDLDKDQVKNILLDSIPPIDKNAVDANIKNSDEFPTLQKYLQYISTNPDLGRDIVVKGINTGVSENSNNNKDIFIVNQALKTSMFAKLKVKFNPGNKFFDHAAIILVDPGQKKIVGAELFRFDGRFKTH